MLCSPAVGELFCILHEITNERLQDATAKVALRVAHKLNDVLLSVHTHVLIRRPSRHGDNPKGGSGSSGLQNIQRLLLVVDVHDFTLKLKRLELLGSNFRIAPVVVWI